MTKKKDPLDRWKRGVCGIKQVELSQYIPPKEKKKHTQIWSAYNKAQAKEKLAIMAILDELLDQVQLPTLKNTTGRKPIPLRDRIFYAVIQAYNLKSSRRCISDIAIAQERSYVQKVPHFNTILNCLNDPLLTLYLKHLITMAGMPLEASEKDFAVDSTGFSTNQFGRWFEVRYTARKDNALRDFVKAHIMIGTHSNIITAVNITPSNKGDSPQLANLFEQTRKVFQPVELSADKAYCSRENFQFIIDRGTIPFIPFPKHVTGKRRGSCLIWGRMYRYYHEQREEFDEHYHKRSNIETVNYMIKTKLGACLRSKTFVSQSNETLARCLCHNLCVLNQEAHEVGISLEFKKCAEIPIAQE